MPACSRRALLPALAAVTVLCGGAIEARAIPAFARRYAASCADCHAPFPRLNSFGEAFAAQGFRLGDDDQPARPDIATGDSLLRLPAELPLSMRLETYFSWKEGATARTDFESPWVWKIISGGPLSRDISWYVYYLTEEGGGGGLEDAWLQVNDLFGSGVALVAGQFQVSDPLFKRELRLERLGYQIYETTIGRSPVRLTYDRGIMLSRALPGGVELSAQVVNGNGIDAAAEEEVSDFVRFDNDRDKDFALRLARRCGPARIGAFGYRGRATAAPGDPTTEPGAPRFTTTATLIGPDLSLDLGARGQLNVEFLYREDRDPFLTGAPGIWRTRGGFAELHWFPRGPAGRWIFSALYNRIVSDDAPADRETFSLTANRLLARNARLVIEAGRDRLAGRSRLTTGLMAAF